jgi:hypothetical protein
MQPLIFSRLAWGTSAKLRISNGKAKKKEVLIE